MFWPYRVTTLANPFRAQRRGGFEGMAFTQDKKKLLPLLELPMAGGERPGSSPRFPVQSSTTHPHFER